MNEADPLGGLIERLQAAAAAVGAVPEEAAALTAPLLKLNVQDIMGTSALLDLAPSTQAERVRLGYTPNDPLVRRGDLRDSIESAAVGPVAVAGTNNPIAEYQEFGTSTIPPRPAFAMGLQETTFEAVEIAHELTVAALKA